MGRRSIQLRLKKPRSIRSQTSPVPFLLFLPIEFIFLAALAVRNGRQRISTGLKGLRPSIEVALDYQNMSSLPKESLSAGSESLCLKWLFLQTSRKEIYNRKGFC